MTHRTLLSLSLALTLAGCSGKAADDASMGQPLAKGADSLVPIGDVQKLPPPGGAVTTTVQTTTTTTTTKPASTTPPAQSSPARGSALSAGAKVETSMIDSVHSRYTRVGDVVRTRVARDVIGTNGKVAIPAGAIVTMHVTAIDHADSKGEKGTLELATTSVEINGHSHALAATATDYEYQMKSRGVGNSEVLKTGAGAAAGAILGRVIGGKSGVIPGAVGGGAVGAVVASETADRDIIVHAGTRMTLTLSSTYGG